MSTSKNGPLAGMEDILRRRKSNCRAVLSVDLIMPSIAKEAEASDLGVALTARRKSGESH